MPFRRKSNRSYVAIKMFKKCIDIKESFVPAYLGLSKIQSGVSSGLLLRKALAVNEESPIVRLEFADWLYANSELTILSNEANASIINNLCRSTHRRLKALHDRNSH